jgi:hypothetical protein
MVPGFFIALRLWETTARMVKIAFAGPLYLVDVIWGAASLHAWLYVSCGIAVFQILLHCLRKYRLFARL